MNKAGQFDDITHFSPGTYQEFEIARANGFTIIPVGSTGYEANIIWKEIKKNINEFYYLSKRMDALRNEKNPEKLAELIVSILDDVTKYRRVK